MIDVSGLKPSVASMTRNVFEIDRPDFFRSEYRPRQPDDGEQSDESIDSIDDDDLPFKTSDLVRKLGS